MSLLASNEWMNEAHGEQALQKSLQSWLFQFKNSPNPILTFWLTDAQVQVTSSTIYHLIPWAKSQNSDNNDRFSTNLALHHSLIPEEDDGHVSTVKSQIAF